MARLANWNACSAWHSAACPVGEQLDPGADLLCRMTLPCLVDGRVRPWDTVSVEESAKQWRAEPRRPRLSEHAAPDPMRSEVHYGAAAE
jgi:hypothetical protein